ncbi:MAG: DUF86 domain-containing protein [Solirubrobacterales bacterium]|nr:DUF86 domain-containing protein [Solirubrobacterales bacterium]
MTHDERDTVLLRELLDLLNLTIERMPSGREAFLADLDKRDATALRIQAIGEHLRSLSDRFRAAHPDLPWRQAIGMRNIIAHDYGDLDYEIVYNVVTGEPFATFRTRVEEILNTRGTGGR